MSNDRVISAVQQARGSVSPEVLLVRKLEADEETKPFVERSVFWLRTAPLVFRGRATNLVAEHLAERYLPGKASFVADYLSFRRHELEDELGQPSQVPVLELVAEPAAPAASEPLPRRVWAGREAVEALKRSIAWPPPADARDTDEIILKFLHMQDLVKRIQSKLSAVEIAERSVKLGDRLHDTTVRSIARGNFYRPADITRPNERVNWLLGPGRLDRSTKTLESIAKELGV